MTGTPKQIANPYSTGGGGDDFQFQVGAYYLPGLLLRLSAVVSSLGSVDAAI